VDRSLTRPQWYVEPDFDGDPLRQPIIIGYDKRGRPIYSIAGGAVSPANVANWIPVEYDSDVVQRVLMESAVEQYAPQVIMRSSTRQIPRSTGMTVSAGTTYTDDASTNDQVTITARRFIARFSIDEDDLADAETRMDVIQTKGMDWAISYADVFDNACLAVTGTENGTTVPFTSMYKKLRTTDSGVSYTADANYAQWDDDLISLPTTPLGTSLYEKLSSTLKVVETSKFWSPVDMLVIAAPGWRDALRLCVDAQGRPIFVQGTAGTPDSLFDTPIAWSRGCKTSATNTGTPTGNDLLFYVNRRFMRRGVRSGPETLTDNARAQDDNDNYSVKFRARRGFILTHPSAAAVLERITD
jgi:hypothetical protein